jgi:S-DNA-T family DNA segregation ATPase FtsK/SpoIIIE
MPLKIPFISPKSNAKPKGKTARPSRGKGKPKYAPQKGRTPPISPPTQPMPVSWWDSLSAERRLDVVGAIMAVTGLLIGLILFYSQRSVVTGSATILLSQILGWGVYVLPAGLVTMGLWLIARRIEKLPPLSLERAFGLVFFFFWLLAAMHSIAAPVELAEEAALDGWGGGYIGSLFERLLFNSLGTAGAIVALLAWLLVTITMIFDISVEDLFRWVAPLVGKIRLRWAKQASPAGEAFLPEGDEAASNGFTPLHRPETPASAAEAGKPVTTVRPAEAVIQWKLPDVKTILDSGSAPEVNEEFIQQRARLIEETLASFGAPAQVVGDQPWTDDHAIWGGAAFS